MTLDEYGTNHGLVTEEDWRNHFRRNEDTGQGPVELYSCPTCRTILWNYPYDRHVCVGGKEVCTYDGCRTL